MESHSGIGGCPIAILNTSCGPLHIFHTSALREVVCSLAPLQVADVQVLDGFNIHQWAEYGRKKAMIASRICKENGRLKLLGTGAPSAGDCVFVKDPWAGGASSKPLPIGADSSDNAWSKWQSRLSTPTGESMQKDVDKIENEASEDENDSPDEESDGSTNPRNNFVDGPDDKGEEENDSPETHMVDMMDLQHAFRKCLDEQINFLKSSDVMKAGADG